MQTVVELHSFTKGAEACGLDQDRINAIVDLVATNPEAGDLIAGTGGCRKLRIAGRGKGKSGGYRTIYFYAGQDIPIFLLAIYGKGDKANLSKLERNRMAAMVARLVEASRRPGAMSIQRRLK